MCMKDRLLKLMAQEGLSAARFADEIGVQRSSVSHILSGRNMPGFDFILKTLSRFRNVNADWLITGAGEMLRSKAAQSLSNDVNDEVLPQYKSSGSKQMHIDTNVTNQPDSKMSTNVNTLIAADSELGVSKIVVFYKNGRFEEFLSSK